MNPELLFISYVYYLTRGFVASIRVFDLLTRGFERVTHGFELVTLISELETCVLIFHYNDVYIENGVTENVTFWSPGTFYKHVKVGNIFN